MSAPPLHVSPTCNRPGCSGMTAWQVKLRFFALGNDTPHEVVTSEGVCDACCEEAQPSDFVGPDQLDFTQRLFSAAGWGVLDRDHIEMDFLPAPVAGCA